MLRSQLGSEEIYRDIHPYPHNSWIKFRNLIRAAVTSCHSCHHFGLLLMGPASIIYESGMSFSVAPLTVNFLYLGGEVARNAKCAEQVPGEL